MNTEQVGQKETTHLSDKDLIQLAGYHGHLNIEDPKVIQVGGNEVEIVDAIHDTSTGLDAFVIREMNHKRAEDVVIIFIGNQQIMVDSNIISPETPIDVKKSAQIKAAKTYFDQIEKKYGSGTVTSVTGNFIAGALANAIAVERRDVRSVTLNPAMLPWSMTESASDYTNITNYYNKHDFLTNTEEALGLGSRVPGNKYHIQNSLSSFRDNYSGYVDQIDGEYKVPVGVKGEAGYGFIHVGADDHIITSLWTGVPLYGGPSSRVKINRSRLFTLVNGLEGKVLRRMRLAQEYVIKANEIVVEEHIQMDQRVNELRESFEDAFDHLADHAMLNGIAKGGSVAISIIDTFFELLNDAEKKTHDLNTIVRFQPKVRHENVPNMNREEPFSIATNHLHDVKWNVEQFIFSIQSVIREDIPDLLGSENDPFIDSVTGKLKDHYSIVHRNISRVLTQVFRFKKQVEDAALTFGQNEKYVHDKVESNVKAEAETYPAIMSLEHLKYTKRIKVKKAQLKEAKNKVNTLVTKNLQPLLESAVDKLAAMENALSTILHSTQSTLHTPFNDNMKEESVGNMIDHGNGIQQTVDRVVQPIREVRKMVRELERGITHLISRLPEMGDYLKSSIDKAIFDPGHYSNIRLYNIACSSILDEMELLFKDITFQLSNEKSAAVQASMETAKSIEENIKLLSKQVQRGIF